MPFRWAAIGLLAICLPAAVAAQDRVLAKPSARLSHQFSTISGVRELADGRVMVSDAIDDVVLRVDLATLKIDTLGRAGSGPGEYRSPDGLFPLPANATMLIDLGNARMDIFDGSGKYRESFPIAQGRPGERPGPVPLVIPRGTDKAGRIYYQPMGGGPRADSAVVVRWDRATARFDTVARVKLPPMIVKSSGGPNNRRESQRQPPYPVQDAWTVGPDGQVVLVRAPQYRVDWIAAAGTRTTGKPIPATPVPIRDAEKKEYQSEMAANGLSVSVQNVNGQVSMAFSRGRQSRDEDEADASKGDDWPATKPATTGFAVVAPGGRVLVERSVAAGAARMFDIVDSTGAVTGRLTLPPGRRLLAVGGAGLYVRHIDGDGISYLERYDWK